ncbi:Arylsulfatase precursor [Pirellulimonas nuda]|uniref:Arylsulfatase n=1 Tax=Pirellulimonas nuda TaxID=2528009 RepID=A0A518D7L5_9BACT|nr:arylsulfatase [Pirellulimonas nuda]QDU87472.1 Arylsulfatase precursor [Pirellulimonas nuda]
MTYHRAGLLLLFICGAAWGRAADRPNIVVILVDDMGYSDIGCFGSEIPTPNIDALAAGGVAFTQAYNTARCSPTRASLLTGHYPHQAGMGHLDGTFVAGSLGYQARIADTSVTLAEVLAPAGYFTAMSGKWHLGQQRGTPPWERGFQRSLNLQAGGTHFPNQTPKAGAKLYLDGEELALNDPRFGDDWYGAELWTDWGLKFIDEARDAGKPFLLYLAHCAPHFPLMAREEAIARYRGKYTQGWDKLRGARHAKQIELGIVDAGWPLAPRPKGVAAWDDLTDAQRDRFDNMMAVYAAMIESIDVSVGRVVDGLRERGELENTLIVFLSDNGGNAESGPNGRTDGDGAIGSPDSNVFLGQSWATLSNTPFRRYKHHTHEGGIATPLILSWPERVAGAERGALNREPVHVIDVMPTALAASGAAYPQELGGHAIEPFEGVSLLPALRGEPLVRTNPILFEHEGNRALREGRWKIVTFGSQPWELYDMRADRTEQHDLAGEQPDRVRAMAARWDAIAKRTHTESIDRAKKQRANKARNKQPAPPAGRA